MVVYFVGVIFRASDNLLKIIVDGIDYGSTYRDPGLVPAFANNTIEVGHSESVVGQYINYNFGMASLALYQGASQYDGARYTSLYAAGIGKLYAELSGGDITDLVAWWDLTELPAHSRLSSVGSHPLTESAGAVKTLQGLRVTDNGSINIEVQCNGTVDTNVMACKDGSMLTNIPTGASTKDVNNLLLLNFS